METAAQAQRNRLDQLAERMKNRIAGQNRQTHTELSHGLHIVMGRMEGQWRLALGREKVAPSDTEVDICRTAFKVPEGASEDRRKHSRRHPKTGRLVVYNVVELQWMEL